MKMNIIITSLKGEKSCLVIKTRKRKRIFNDV